MATPNKLHAFPCRVCGVPSTSFHFGACDKCTKLAVEAAVKAKEESR